MTGTILDIKTFNITKNVVLQSFLGFAVALIVNFVSSSTLLFIILMVVMLAPIAVDLIKKKFDLFEIKNVFTVGYFMAFGISTLYSLNIRLRYIDDAIFDRTLPKVLIYAIISIIFFYVGYYNGIPVSLARKLPILHRTWNEKRVPLVIIAFTLLGISSYFILLYQTGGLLYYIQNFYRINDLLAGNYYLFMFAKSFLFSALIICYVWAQESSSTGYVVCSYVLLMLAFIFSIATGYRGTVFLPILSMIIIRYYISSKSKKRFEKYFVVLFIVINVLFIPIYSAMRYSDAEVDAYDLVVKEDSSKPINILASTFSRYYGIESFALIVDKIDHGLELQLGNTLFSFFYEFIPRDLWPDKPFSTGFLFIDTFMPDVFLNRSVAGISTLPGELFWNFSLIGMLIGMMVVGFLFKISYIYFKMNCNKSSILLYLPFIYYAFSINEGSIAGHAITELISFGMPLFIGYLAVCSRRLVISIYTQSHR